MAEHWLEKKSERIFSFFFSYFPPIEIEVFLPLQRRKKDGCKETDFNCEEEILFLSFLWRKKSAAWLLEKLLVLTAQKEVFSSFSLHGLRY